MVNSTSVHHCPPPPPAVLELQQPPAPSSDRERRESLTTAVCSVAPGNKDSHVPVDVVALFGPTHAARPANGFEVSDVC